MAKNTFDVLIVGAGPAGLAAATSIARQNHTALVFDSRTYRNANVSHMHNVLGWDHQNPATLRQKARQDLVARYPCISFRDKGVAEIRRQASGLFGAVDETGQLFTGRKVFLGTGVKDLMPDIPGYDDCWGRGIFHCLYCHGYEDRGKASTGVLAGGLVSEPPTIVHMARMALRFSGKTTVYTHGNEALAEAVRQVLPPGAVSKVAVDSRRITRLALVSPDASDVQMTFEDGAAAAEGFLVNAPSVELNGPFAQQLSIETNPSGEIKTFPPFYATSVQGVFAGGDAATMMRSVAYASMMGSLAGVGVATEIQAEDLQTS